MAGPWSFGTQRSTLAKAFQEWGWEAKPLQPIPRVSGNGLWWAIQALKPPPQAVLHIQQGEVLVSEVKSKPDGKLPQGSGCCCIPGCPAGHQSSSLGLCGSLGCVGSSLGQAAGFATSP